MDTSEKILIVGPSPDLANFSKEYTQFIIDSKNHINDIDNILLQNDNIAMRKLIQKIHNHEYIDLLIKVYESIKCKKSEELRLLYHNNKNIPLDVSQIALDGNTITKKFNKKGKDIGIIKSWLFDEITKGNVNNIKNNLIEYMLSLDLFRV